MAELTAKDKAQLAYLYELDEYKALKKLLDNERLDIAKRLLVASPTDVALIARLQGQAQALKEVNLKLKLLHGQESKKV